MVTFHKKHLAWTFVILVIFSGFVFSINQQGHKATKYSVDYNREIIAEKEEGVARLIATGRYKCCLKKPCSYCFSDSEDQEEDLVCSCLEKITNGEHPCGECIGEMLEGNGNPLVTEYFASAIAEKIGKQHLDTLKQIIKEKYNFPVERQF